MKKESPEPVRFQRIPYMYDIGEILEVDLIESNCCGIGTLLGTYTITVIGRSYKGKKDATHIIDGSYEERVEYTLDLTNIPDYTDRADAASPEAFVMQFNNAHLNTYNKALMLV